jgi:hypothetical protein
MEKVHSHNFIRFEDVECVFDGQMMDDIISSLKLVELKCAVLVIISTTSVVVGGGLWNDLGTVTAPMRLTRTAEPKPKPIPSQNCWFSLSYSLSDATTTDQYLTSIPM